MRIVFLGSGAFAIPSFEALVGAGHEVAAVFTQPDRHGGRGRRLLPPPLKPVALRHRVEVFQPPRIREPDAVAALQRLSPEILVVVAYGQILPTAVIGSAPRGAVNVHASLLPRYRGAAPIQWAIVNGETTTGVTTMLIDQGLDTGPLLLSREVTISPEETAAELEARLAPLGAQVLLETLDGLASGALLPLAQDHAAATLAPLIRKAEGRIDWQQPAEVLERRVRGFTPWPGTTCRVRGRDLKILRARASDQAGPAGTVLRADKDGLVVGCGEGSLVLLQVQPESGRPMSAAAFAAGARIIAGSRLDDTVS